MRCRLPARRRTGGASQVRAPRIPADPSQIGPDRTYLLLGEGYPCGRLIRARGTLYTDSRPGFRSPKCPKCGLAVSQKSSLFTIFRFRRSPRIAVYSRAPVVQGSSEPGFKEAFNVTVAS